ncbi:MAG: heavy-metal-associated domain-containing protein [Bacteroidota bacterium]|nr:heavy-metal-associated domain-containing protein [Bacteroidota bacterium]
MRKIYLILITTILIIGCDNNKKTETITVKHQTSITNPEISFGVRGNCGMCKTTIQKAALSVDGVEEASWDIETKVLDIRTNSNLDSITIKIHNAVAKSGYDTELVLANPEDYNNLPGCCQYNREMEISSKN